MTDEAKPKKAAKPKTIKVECVRKFFIEDLTSEEGTKMILPGEIATIPVDVAKGYQKSGVAMVVIDD